LLAIVSISGSRCIASDDSCPACPSAAMQACSVSRSRP
jgi:hypothetical protein